MKHRNRNHHKNNLRRGGKNREYGSRDNNREESTRDSGYKDKSNNHRDSRHDHARHDARAGDGSGNNRFNNSDFNRGQHRQQTLATVLPSPEILQEYEYASEGTVQALLQMAKDEQDRRNAWELEYLRFHKKSIRLGQLFGFVLLSLVIIAVMFLASIEQEAVAKVLAISGFAAVALSSLFSEVGRRLARRPRRHQR